MLKRLNSSQNLSYGELSKKNECKNYIFCTVYLLNSYNDTYNESMCYKVQVKKKLLIYMHLAVIK